MNRLGLASVVLFVAASTAAAQPGSTYPYNLNLYGPGLANPLNSTFTRPGPALSPYLNLLRGGNPAANYYLGVIPEVQRRSNAAAFSAGILDLAQRGEATPEAVGQELFPALPQTGHAVQFFNYGGYYGSGLTGRPQQQAGQATGAIPPPRRR